MVPELNAAVWNAELDGRRVTDADLVRVAIKQLFGRQELMDGIATYGPNHNSSRRSQGIFYLKKQRFPALSSRSKRIWTPSTATKRALCPPCLGPIYAAA